MTLLASHLRSVSAALLAAATLAACSATIPLEGERSRGRIAHDLGISADHILNQQRCSISRYDGTTGGTAFECVYIATAEYAAVLDFDTTKSRFREALRISRQSDAIAFATRGTLFGTIGQIQVRHGELYYILDFVNADMGAAGHLQDLRDAYAQLLSGGVPEFAGMAYVQRAVQPIRMMFIPVPVR
jgi:hypothetical protein